MNINQKPAHNLNDSSLQSEPNFCNLQTGCNLESNKINDLEQFADCRMQIATHHCNLTKSPVNTGAVASFSDCETISSLYEREGVTQDNPSQLEEENLSGGGEVILCLDLGTTSGWAIRSAQGLITSGTVNFKNSRWQGGGMRFLKFTRFLKELNQNAGPISQVYFEEVRRHLGVDAAHAYGGFMAHLTAWCEQHSVAYEGVPVGTIKRHATGKGNANKAMMIESVKARGHHPADDNEADAIALLYWAIDQIGGQL